MNAKTALRLAFALERIADRLELLTLESEPQTPESPVCPHPESYRLALGQTNGWMCSLCQHTESTA